MTELLPPVGWADVATTRDLDHLERNLRAEIDRANHQVRADLSRQLLNQTPALLAANATMLAIAVGAARLG